MQSYHYNHWLMIPTRINGVTMLWWDLKWKLQNLVYWNFTWRVIMKVLSTFTVDIGFSSFGFWLSPKRETPQALCAMAESKSAHLEGILCSHWCSLPIVPVTGHHRTDTGSVFPPVQLFTYIDRSSPGPSGLQDKQPELSQPFPHRRDAPVP